MTGAISSIPDPSFDRYARLVRSTVGVPVALVSIVEEARQIFPGAVGLPAPWQSARETPLTHSFCQYVVADREPLIIADARLDPRVVDNLAITDLNVVAYAGFPLSDDTGRVVGALCAIDIEPRAWSDDELETLRDLAAACSTELALRETRRRAEEAERVANAASLHARGLLSLSEGLAATLEVSDVAVAVQLVAEQALDAAHAGLWIFNDTRTLLRYVRHPKLCWAQAERRAELDVTEVSAISDVARTGQSLLFSSERDRTTQYPSSVSRDGEERANSAAYVPLGVAGQLLGALALTWAEPRSFTDSEIALCHALAAYAAPAIERAQLLTRQAHSVLRLQQAMLTELPQPDHVELQARYVPAATHHLVGGDWYDAVLLQDGATMIAIGDVVGHDIEAAALMGQIRSTLRALAWSLHETPAALVARLDQTLNGLRTGALATLLAARIEQTPDDAARGVRTLRWTNAGHLPAVLVGTDGAGRLLGSRPEPMLGILPGCTRTDHTTALEPGSTLVLYTDGLIETRDADIDTNLARLVAAVERNARLPLTELLDVLVDELVDRPSDDIAVLALRFHPEGRPRPDGVPTDATITS